MEINITRFFTEAAPRDYSASVAEIGSDAAADTWRAAMDDADDYNLLDTDEKRDAFRDHVKGFGAWEDSEIAAWSNQELNALCIQLIAGDIREAEALNWDTERCGGRICRPVDSTDGEAYYYLGD